MSDLEKKLRSITFREPPQDIRRRVLAATPRWTWRDWFWPSPLAWGAIAAVWVVCLATQESGREEHPTEQRTSSTAQYALAQFSRNTDIEALIFTP